MRVLVVGSGAREHALIRGLLADPAVVEVIAAPGNAGIAGDVTTRPLDVSDAAAVGELAAELNVDLVVIGPELPLVAGAADAVRERGIPCFGPSAEAAQLEGSKAFAKMVMAEANVPTAMALVCSSMDDVERALDQFGAPYVVKDDGLAAGKGVVVTDDRAAAVEHARACIDNGDAGAVVIEEYLAGPEVSLFALSDGLHAVPLQPAQDFKRLADGDAGPNTGGMGAYSPLSWAPDDLVDDVMQRVIQPTIDAMRHRGTPFVGLLYAGLALTPRGLRVVEFNARFGDPETQVVLSLLATPLGRLLHAAATGSLDAIGPLQWRAGAAVTVVIASANYPSTPVTGDVITGIEMADAREGVQVFHAGTARSDGDVVSAGGRVLSVTAYGDTVDQARERVYAAVADISLAGAQYRTDIAAHA